MAAPLPSDVPPRPVAPATPTNPLIKVYPAWLARLRCNQIWFHAAHHLTTGPSFLSDHALYGDIYGAYGSAYDAIAEKACGAGLCALVEPAVVLRGVVAFLGQLPTLDGMPADEIARAALAVEQKFLAVLQADVGAMGAGAPLGLDDELRSIANAHDGFVYKLGQRVR